MKPLIFMTFAASFLFACEQTPKTYTAAEVKAKCEEERRDAQGPRTNVSIGANSRTGLNTGLSISLNDKFIRGVDPETAYENCMARFQSVPAQ